MIRGFWSARTGLLAHQQRMDLISNNMANVNTVGYKPMRTSFQDLIYQNMNRPAAQDTAMTGHGVKVNHTDLLMEQGALEQTDRPFDMALLGDGEFFMLEAPNGDYVYSRAGNFYPKNEDGDLFLVDANGYRVLDMDGEEIELFHNAEGRIDFLPEQVGVYRFPNAYGLTPIGGNHYIQTETSGEPEAVENPAYQVGYLERSGVNIAQEMVNVIEASKAFTLNARMSQVTDEIEQTINSLR